MKFSSIILGSRFTWRNKRRVIIASAGLIIATAVLSSLFLVSSYQYRVEIMTYIDGSWDNHVGFHATQPGYPYTCNVTDLGTINDIIDEIAPRHGIDGYSVDIQVDMPATRYYWAVNGTVIQKEHFIITPNSTINWDTLTLPWQIREITFRARSDLARYFSSTMMAGSLPTVPGEIALSEVVALEQNLTIGSNIYVGNNLSRQISGPYEISGIVTSPSLSSRIVVASYDTMSIIAQQLTGTGNISVDHAGISVKFNTDGINLYSINAFLDKIAAFGLELQNAVGLRRLNFEFYDFISTLGNNMYLPILSMIIQYVPFMLPLILLALFISRFINTELLKTRERELALLKSRGYTGGNVKRIVATELVFSSLVSSSGSAMLSIAFSYVLVPLAGFSSTGGIQYVSEYVPFPNAETLGLFITIVLATTFFFNFTVHYSELAQMLDKDAKTPVEQAIVARQRKINWRSSITLMLVLGIVPIVIQVITLVSPIPRNLAIIEPIFAVMLVPAPLFLAASVLKILADKYPAVFTKLFSLSARWIGNGPKAFVDKRIAARSKAISQLVIMITITVGFGFATGLLTQNIPDTRDELYSIKLASDIQVSRASNFTESTMIQDTLETNENITATSKMFQTFGFIDQEEYTYQMQYMYFTNVTEMKAISSTFKPSYLSEGDWDQIAATFDSEDPAVLLPASYKGLFNTSSVKIGVYMEIYESSGGYWSRTWTADFTIAGYYKYFPGIYWGEWKPTMSQVSFQSLPLVANLAAFTPDILSMSVQSSIASNVSGLKLPFTFFIDTPIGDQHEIDALATSLGFSQTRTMTTMLQAGLDISGGMLDNPSIPGLLRVVTITSLVLSIVSYSLISFMRITADRHEIGILQVRGFPKELIRRLFSAEHFLPFVVAAGIGTICGIFSGSFFLNMVAHDFQLFHLATHPLIAMSVNLLDVLMLITLPIIIIYIVSRSSIDRECRKEFAEAMAVED